MFHKNAPISIHGQLLLLVVVVVVVEAAAAAAAAAEAAAAVVNYNYLQHLSMIHGTEKTRE